MNAVIKKNALPFLLGAAAGIVVFAMIKSKKSVTKTTVTETKVEENKN